MLFKLKTEKIFITLIVLVVVVLIGSAYFVHRSKSSSIFVIIPSYDSNGFISPNTAQKVSSGSSDTFTITPSIGFYITSVLVDGSSIGVVDNYTFPNISKNHTISAIFAAYTASLTANSLKIVSGKSALLTWTSNAASCSSVDFNTGGAPSNIVGVSVSPTSTKRYAIDCGGQSVSVIITVLKLPVYIYN